MAPENRNILQFNLQGTGAHSGSGWRSGAGAKGGAWHPKHEIKRRFQRRALALLVNTTVNSKPVFSEHTVHARTTHWTVGTGCIRLSHGTLGPITRLGQSQTLTNGGPAGEPTPHPSRGTHRPLIPNRLPPLGIRAVHPKALGSLPRSLH